MYTQIEILLESKGDYPKGMAMPWGISALESLGFDERIKKRYKWIISRTLVY